MGTHNGITCQDANSMHIRPDWPWEPRCYWSLRGSGLEPVRRVAGQSCLILLRAAGASVPIGTPLNVGGCMGASASASKFRRVVAEEDTTICDTGCFCLARPFVGAVFFVVSASLLRAAMPSVPDGR